MTVHRSQRVNRRYSKEKEKENENMKLKDLKQKSGLQRSLPLKLHVHNFSREGEKIPNVMLGSLERHVTHPDSVFSLKDITQNQSTMEKINHIKHHTTSFPKARDK